MDHVDEILRQWRSERPELDTSSMGLIGRLSRVSAQFATEMDKTFRVFGLNAAGFDVLATLRRSGAPFALSPGDLIAATMVTSGTMTNRIDRLSEADLVERIKNPEDSRSALVRLTPRGRDLIDKAVEAHVETQQRLLEPLDARDRQDLVKLLRKLGVN